MERVFSPPIFVGERMFEVVVERAGREWAEANLRKYEPLPTGDTEEEFAD